MKEGLINMDIMEAMACRHSVRSYTDQIIEKVIIDELQKEIDICNQESGLDIRFFTEEPKAFSGMRAHYGKFSGVNNYIALIGNKSEELNEKIGYYGERILLKATLLGLDSCWVAMTFSRKKSPCKLSKNQKMVCVITVGYGVTKGNKHKDKDMTSFYDVSGDVPDWFLLGVKAAMMGPTAMNQQKFHFTLTKDGVKAKATGGFYSDVDLGIVKYHFELGAGNHKFNWVL